MKLPRRWRIFIMVVVSLFVLWAIYYVSISIIYGIKLRSLRKQALAEGSSLNLVELASKYNPRPSDREKNAAPLYKAADMLLSPIIGPSPEADAYGALFVKNRPEERANVISQNYTELSSLLEKNKLSIQLLHEAGPCETVWFDVDYSKGANTSLPHLSELRSLARMSSLEAWIATEDGNSHKALQSVWAGLRLRRGIEKEPIIISHLVGFAMDTLTLRTLQEVIPLAQPTEPDLRNILTELQSRDPKAFLIGAEGERALLAGAFNSARKNGLSHFMQEEIVVFGRQGGGPTALDYALVRILNGLRPDEAYSLSYLNRFVDAASRVNTLRSDEAYRWQADESTTAHNLGEPFPSKYFHVLSSTVLPAYGRILGQAKQDIARRDVATCGIAAELYRLDRGEYPASLDALTPKYLETIPKDTFTGEALHFTSLPNGILIYSLGLNGKDDAGLFENEQGTDDIAWRVERTVGKIATP